MYYEIGLLMLGYLNLRSLDPLIEQLEEAVSANRSLTAAQPADNSILTR